MPEVVVNTSPLQYLHQLGLLHLLRSFYGKVNVPQAVEDELTVGRTRGYSVPVIRELDWVAVRPIDQSSLLRLVTDLGRGEREVLALALEMPGCLVVLDDGQARRHAQVLGLNLTGTLGILIRAKREGKLPALDPVLDQLERLRFHFDQAT